MTKRKANPQPFRYQPGNQYAKKEETLVRCSLMVIPEQLAWLKSQPDGISATVRKAIDLLISSRDGIADKHIN